jgi:hypothetical protein
MSIQLTRCSSSSLPFTLQAMGATTVRLYVPTYQRPLNPDYDVLILKATLLRLLVKFGLTAPEMSSMPKYIIRMLLEGAAIVRFANTSFKTKKEQRVCRALYNNTLAG